MKSLHLLIAGQVQGVFFRRHVKAKADELGITGWARNTEDGKVEIVAEGEESGGKEGKLAEFLAWCREGPPPAKVESVKIKWDLAGKKEFSSFQIRY